MKPTEITQLLLIAGTGRNTGKTTLACHILGKFSSGHSVISLKITPHFHLLFDGETMDFNPDAIAIRDNQWTLKN